MAATRIASFAETLLGLDGEAGRLIAGHDWTGTPLGPIDTWPPSLKTSLGLILMSPVPIVLLWGSDGIMLYNDAYSVFAGRRHPRLLGSKVREGWPEVADFNDNVMKVGLSGGRLSYRDQELTLHRNGHPEQVWMNLDYSPVPGDDGRPAGVVAIVVETTERVLIERRQAFLLDLESRLRAETEPNRVLDVAVESLGKQLGADRVGYGQVHSDGETVTLVSCYANGVEPLLGSYRLDGFGPDSIERQRGGVVEVCNDVEADPAQVQDTWSAIETRAFVSVPLVRDGEFRASLYVNSRLPRRWSAAEVQLITDVAARTWEAAVRARAEAVQRESEARFRLMADAVPQIVWITDAEGRAEFFNRQWFDYSGTDRMLATAVDVAEQFVHPDDAARTVERFEEARRVGRVFEVEHRIRSAGGDYRWFLVRGEPYRDPQTGEIVRWFGASVDIHDRRQAEAALRESEEQLRLATEAAEVGLWDLDVTTDTLFWPARVKAMFGISPDVPISMADYYAGLHADDAEATSASFAAAFDPAKRALYDVEYRTIGKEDGTIRWVAAKGRALFDGDGQCVRVIGTAIDITARKAVEQRLRELNDTLETEVQARTAERNRVWEMSRDLLAIMGFDGHLKAINPAWETTLGRDAATLLEMPFQEQVHPEDHDAVRAVMEVLLRGETAERFEDRLRHADGSWRWISWTLVPEGEVFYAVGRDVTAEKEAASALEHAQEALRQSQKMEAMGQLTGGVAHDFNNLLTPIIGSLDMLIRRGVGNERERRLIDGALQSAERARTLVQRLLAFARRQPLQATAVNVSQLVSGMAGLVESTLGPKIDIRLDMTPDLPPARADANQLEMALLNLAVNARDAMPHGGTLSITAAPEHVQEGHRANLSRGDYIRLAVSDTGTGMDIETIRRAVEPFFSTKGIGKGTGLGLSMVHGLVAQLGGAMAISSKPDAGTTVELWLPMSSEPPVGGDADMRSIETVGSRGRALLVDDEELVRMSTADMLMDLGFDVVEAASAEEALRILKNGEKPDLIVTDHLMPGMSGAELAQEVRVLTPQLPILIVSGYAEVEGIAPDLPRLTKPFRNAELAESIDKLGEPAA